jgi:hypothetical protein
MLFYGRFMKNTKVWEGPAWLLETFSFTTAAGKTILFNVKIAQEAINAGRYRQLVAVPTEILEHIVRNNEIDPDHIDDADPGIPGIFAPCRDGAVILIDGNHRAAHALKHQKPFHAYILTDEDTRAAIINIHDDAIDELVP